MVWFFVPYYGYFGGFSSGRVTDVSVVAVTVFTNARARVMWSPETSDSKGT